MSASLTLVRHGETLGESSIRLNGVTDVVLNELGKQQMRCVAAALAGVAFDAIVTSPLRRASESAALIRPERVAEMLPELRELNFGDWETLTWSDVARRDPAAYQRCRVYSDDFTYPGGESRDGFRRRVGESVLRELSQRRGHTLAVLHKGVIKIAIATLLGRPVTELKALPCELGSIHRLHRRDNSWILTSQNEVAHLGQWRSVGSH